ncbi:MAG: response regulator [Bacteroidetes bacterium]|nr:response regulator [Bacteroidota bacterium]
MNTNLHPAPISILLADDDIDDCAFFERALSELPVLANLSIVRNGEEVMEYLNESAFPLPDILFLDLSMPRKTGFECLLEIKENEYLKNLDIVIFSTSYGKDMNYENDMIKMLYKFGAMDYIKKPGDFNLLKQVIHNSLLLITEKKYRKGA